MTARRSWLKMTTTCDECGGSGLLFPDGRRTRCKRCQGVGTCERPVSLSELKSLLDGIQEKDDVRSV